MTTIPRRSARIGLVAVALTASTVALATAVPNLNLTLTGAANRLDGDQTSAVRKAVEGGPSRNVILLIGDGMGDSEITIARNYAKGAAGAFAGIDALPLTGQMTTYSVTTDGTPDYDPDSASTGTAWATGTKTYDGAISVNVDGTPQTTLLEQAKAAGLRTGDVSTAAIQDATPAVQYAHVSSRSCFGPTATSAKCPENALENGGAGSITEQLLDTRPDVTLGGGAETFAETATAGDYAGMTLLDQAEQRGYQVVTNASELEAVTAANQTTPLLGLFADGNMEVRWQGPAATADGGALDPVACTDNPARTDAQPTLAQLTDKAISLLNTKKSGKGFFLQVEGASIDKQDHAANACGQIGETVDLDEAVQVALAFAKADGNTTVIVTADHAHTSQIVQAGTTTPGITVNLLTADQAPMTINYATSEAGSSMQHTGTQLRVAGYGPGAANLVGLIDETDLNTIISRQLKTDSSAIKKKASRDFRDPKKK